MAPPRLPFEVTETLEDRAVILRVRGELDLATAPILEKKVSGNFFLRSPLEERPGPLAPPKVPLLLVLSLAQVSFIDSAGIAALVIAAHRLRARGGELRLVAKAPAVLKILELAGLTEWFAIYATAAEALAR
jgi:anti-sigma B factor antagonist